MTERPHCLVQAKTTWNRLTEQSRRKKTEPHKISALLPPNNYSDNKPSYLKLLNRKRRKSCLYKLSAKSQSQTHLHLLDCQSAFNFSGSESPCPVSHRNPVISLQTPCAKGLLMIQACVWVAIWASPAHTHTPWRMVQTQGLQRWCECMCEALWQWVSKK